jgi:hypothetical protein
MYLFFLPIKFYKKTKLMNLYVYIDILYICTELAAAKSATHHALTGTNVCTLWTLIRCIFIVTKCTMQCNLKSVLLCIKHNRIRQHSRSLYKPSSERYKVFTSMNLYSHVWIYVYEYLYNVNDNYWKQYQKYRTIEHKGGVQLQEG